jgi:hypothetical protein
MIHWHPLPVLERSLQSLAGYSPAVIDDRCSSAARLAVGVRNLMALCLPLELRATETSVLCSMSERTRSVSQGPAERSLNSHSLSRSSWDLGAIPIGYFEGIL